MTKLDYDGWMTAKPRRFVIKIVYRRVFFRSVSNVSITYHERVLKQVIVKRYRLGGSQKALEEAMLARADP